jgi:uncharacterized protein YggL (DUF469 family)
MNRDDIIRMAREANADKFITENFWIFDGSELERFAALVAAAEREACAQVCQEKWLYTASGFEMADYIRARGWE